MKFKTISTLILTLLCLSSALFGINLEKSDPLSVLIIGGGPAGLATAIEAKKSGAKVTLIEKRNEYSRPQRLFLFDPSIQLLKRWQVTVPQLQIAELGDGSCIGFVEINRLEEGLENKVKELDIQRIQGEFKALGSNKTAVISTPEQEELKISYDIIVGADGAHSRVREVLGLEINHLGSAVGAFAFVPDPTDTSTEIDVSPPIRKDAGFLRRIKAPSVSILLMQSPMDSSKEQLQKIATECGWHKEALLIGEDKAFIATDIPITLQQTLAFSSKNKSAILVGDATATASFFQGMGANTALKTAEIAGRFFQSVQKQRPTAYQDFNQSMKETTDAMIEDSAFLFNPTTASCE
jgi:2-polyprenyl-6-methoxyphenol hydroxylase-like FAD-dependent oxidoreductase